MALISGQHVKVEFFGIPARRAGVAETIISLDQDQDSLLLCDLTALIVQRFPGLHPDCIADGEFTSNVRISLNATRFITDPQTILNAGSNLIILSADAGG